MKRLLVVIGILLIAIVAGIILFYASEEKNKFGKKQGQGKKKPPPAVAVAPARVDSIFRTVALTGSVEPVRIAILASPAEGPVQNLKVREGDSVKKGSVLLTVGRQQAAEAALASAQQDLRTEKEELERTKELLNQNVVPPSQLEAARAKYERAVSALSQAEENVRDYRVESPWDGIVSRVMVYDGNYVSPRTPLIEIFDPSELVIRTAVPERFTAEVRRDMTAIIYLDAFPEQTFRAVITRVYPDLDRELRTRIVEFTLRNAPAIAPGMFARIELELKRADKVVVVPRAALLTLPNGKTVLFVISNGTAIRRDVVLGIEEEDFVQILSGVEAGEQVVVAGGEKLKDGAAVRVADSEKKAKVPDAKKRKVE